ncbi:MAG: succinate dehydrogenase cytochrome b558 subunit [Simkaniaceae bacterium]
MSAKVKKSPLNKEFLWRRVHSLTGLFIVLFLIEHLLTNSQAALLIGDNGEGFIRAVNFIKNLPYLPVIEIVLLGVPFAIHGFFGIKYALTGKINSYRSSGIKPSLPEYGRNRAYTWQRMTSWILLVGVIAHVAYMRFYRYPTELNFGDTRYFFTRVNMDPGLYTVADRLGVEIYTPDEIAKEEEGMQRKIKEMASTVEKAEEIREKEPKGLQSIIPIPYNRQNDSVLTKVQTLKQQERFIKALKSKSLSSTEVMTVSKDFGTATLLVVRDAFKGLGTGILYTVFVLSAVFHGFNGLWTFMITWGWVIRMRSQSKMVNFCIGFMIVVGFLGLAAIWGPYWINLRN